MDINRLFLDLPLRQRLFLNQPNRKAKPQSGGRGERASKRVEQRTEADIERMRAADLKRARKRRACVALGQRDTARELQKGTTLIIPGAK